MKMYSCFNADFKDLCAIHSDREMIFHAYGESNKVFSYKQVFEYTKRFAFLFKEWGLKAGDTIVTVLPNSPEAIICFFAAAMNGINYAPLPCTVSSREYDNWVKLISPQLILIKRNVLDFDYAHGQKVIEIEADGQLDWLPEETMEYTLCTGAKLYLVTSGTTGTPKAMQIDVDKLWSSGKAFVSFYKLVDSECRFWNFLPMSYLGGLYNLALIPLCCNGSFVISEPFSGKTILNFWNFIKKYNITAIWFVPSIVHGLLKIYRIVGKRHDDVCKNIKVAFLGTAPISLKEKEEFEEICSMHLYENFALSESTFLTAENRDDLRYREERSVGRKLPYVELKLIPVEDLKGINTIWIKTPYLFDGYLTESGNLNLELDEEGFFNSKDLGYYNEDGILVLAGRSRDIIKKGGLFVSLAEIENVVASIDYIEAVTAVPIEHEFYGESYVLCVIFCGNIEEKRQCEVLRTWMLHNFVSYKMPDHIYAMKEFPKTASGKIMKKEILKKLSKE